MRLNIKNIIFFLLLVSCSSPVAPDDFSKMQARADDSSLSELQKEVTFYNASFIAFRDQFRENRDFIEISEEQTDFYYDALVTVLSSEAGKEHEIIQEMRIHSFFSLTALLANPENDAPFLQDWEDLVEATGISAIDSLLVDRGYEIGSIFEWGASQGKAFVFNNSTPYNTWYISQLLEETGHIKDAESYSTTGDGDDVRIEQVETESGRVLKVTFAYGYRDCAAGCIYEDHYIFHVSRSGNVEFVEKIVKA